MESKLTKNQKRKLVKTYVEDGKNYKIKVELSYDDECGNGHNTFAMTADIFCGNRWESGGCQHEEIAKHFPELKKYIKYHLMSSDGPLHYLANTLYHASNKEGKERELNYARSSAVWPKATDEQLCSDNLKELLEARLPQLIKEFKTAMEELEFIF